MNDDILLASVAVSIGIVGGLPDEGCAFGISITIRIDVYLFRVGSRSTKNKALNDKFRSNEDVFIETKRELLESYFKMWSDFIDKNQKDARFRLLRNQEDLNQEVVRMGKEQYRIRALIENVIFEIDDFMTNRKLNKEVLKRCYLLLSNAFQLIRDLSITFCFGEVSLRSTMDCSDEAEAISRKWISKEDEHEVLDLIKLRRQYSKEIEQLTNSTIDNNNAYVEFKRNKTLLEREIVSLEEKISRTEIIIAVSEKKYENDAEYKHIESIIEKKNSRLIKYESERREIKAEIEKTGFLGFSKKKKLCKRLDEIENEMNTINQDIDKNKIELANMAETKNNCSYANEKTIIENDIQIRRNEIININEKMLECENNVKKSSSEIESVMNQYEEITKKLNKWR